MHELSLAQAVVDAACRHASGRRIERVDLRVGRLRQVVPSALTFAFELVAEGTEAEGAELAIEFVPARLRCEACTVESETHAFPLRCARCGGFDVDVVAGEEFEIESLDVLEEPVAAGRS